MGQLVIVAVGMEAKQRWQKSKINFHPPHHLHTELPDDVGYFEAFPRMAFDVCHDLPTEAGDEVSVSTSLPNRDAPARAHVCVLHAVVSVDRHTYTHTQTHLLSLALSHSEQRWR
jgi:hypothetical protein